MLLLVLVLFLNVFSILVLDPVSTATRYFFLKREGDTWVGVKKRKTMPDLSTKINDERFLDSSGLRR